MVELVVDIRLGRVSNLCKVTDHPIIIEGWGFDGDGSLYRVSMEVSALAAVIHKAVSVTEVEFFCDRVHSDAYSAQSPVRQGNHLRFSIILIDAFINLLSLNQCFTPEL